MKISLVALLVLLSACVSRPPLKETDNTPRVRVMTFNVENLFDTEDDPEKNDESFLPVAKKDNAIMQNRCRVQNSSAYRISECLNNNWTDALVKRKLSRLADVVAQVNNGLGPDILILQEIESLEILQKFRDEHLKEMGYSTLAYVKGPDERGINPAVLSRLPMIGEPKLHEIDFSTLEKNPRPSRGILEAHLRLPNGDPLAVFAVHFPSQGAPTEFRKLAIQNLLDATGRVPAGYNVIVGGDFNITSKEDFKQRYFQNVLAKEFAVSHLVGCKTCAGTTFYNRDKTWSFFDVLLFSKSLTGPTSPWLLDADSIRIVNSSIYQVRFDGGPARFRSGGGATGVSDHWPMYAELILNEPKAVGAN